MLIKMHYLQLKNNKSATTPFFFVTGNPITTMKHQTYKKRPEMPIEKMPHLLGPPTIQPIYEAEELFFANAPTIIVT
jgi:hypothetical protein